jgi:hypothetical protein
LEQSTVLSGPTVASHVSTLVQVTEQRLPQFTLQSEMSEQSYTQSSAHRAWQAAALEQTGMHCSRSEQSTAQRS